MIKIPLWLSPTRRKHAIAVLSLRADIEMHTDLMHCVKSPEAMKAIAESISIRLHGTEAL